jgi:hypothetical protein
MAWLGQGVITLDYSSTFHFARKQRRTLSEVGGSAQNLVATWPRVQVWASVSNISGTARLGGIIAHEFVGDT